MCCSFQQLLCSLSVLLGGVWLSRNKRITYLLTYARCLCLERVSLLLCLLTSNCRWDWLYGVFVAGWEDVLRASAASVLSQIAVSSKGPRLESRSLLQTLSRSVGLSLSVCTSFCMFLDIRLSPGAVLQENIWRQCPLKPSRRRRRVASAEGGRIERRVGGIWVGMSLPQPIKGSGERHELSQRGLGRSPDRKRILAYFKFHPTLLLTPIMLIIWVHRTVFHVT